MIGINDSAIWVDDSGERNLPVILCLHSLWMDGSMFDGLADAAKGKYRLIRPDFRAQGKSAPSTDKKIGMDMNADDIDALIDMMQLSSINIVAQSMGGDVALRLAARRPELYRSLVLLGSSARNEPQEMLDWGYQWLIDAKPTGFTGEHLETLAAIMFGETTRSDPKKAEMVQYWRAKMSALPTSLWPSILGVLERKSVVETLSDIPTPTLVVGGEEDSPRPPEWSREVVAHMPNAALMMVEKIGHSVILEAPEIVLPKILSFIHQPYT